jgi:hypothetical protein
MDLDAGDQEKTMSHSQSVMKARTAGKQIQEAVMNDGWRR